VDQAARARLLSHVGDALIPSALKIKLAEKAQCRRKFHATVEHQAMAEVSPLSLAPSLTPPRLGQESRFGATPKRLFAGLVSALPIRRLKVFAGKGDILWSMNSP